MADRKLEVHSIGSRGDGIAGPETAPVFVPFGLPGEVVQARVENARALDPEWIQLSPNRVEPVCRHFGDCGGCKMQHLSASEYNNWKAGLVSQALAHAGIFVDLEPSITCNSRSRRKATFSAVVKIDGVDVGFQRTGSHHVVNIEDCHVITKRLAAATTAIGALAAVFSPRGKTITISVLDSQNGLDVSANGDFRISDNQRQKISAFAVREKLARVAHNGETIIENMSPRIDLSGFPVAPPSGGFVQAVKSTEESMVTLVCDHLKKCKRVADIFSGSGTFALPLSRNSSVVAAEGEEASLTALSRAWRESSSQGLKPVKTEKRDLHNRPFMAKELELMKIQGVVFDPPRAGAEMQAKELAKSKVRRVAAVSCNPVTLARDLKILIDGGFSLVSVTPLDQFLWSPHVEAVALLVRGKG